MKPRYMVSESIPVLIILTFSLLSFSCSVNDATHSDPYLNIPDNRFEEKLIQIGIDSEGTLDQQLLKTDAEAVTHLDVSWSGGDESIRDLTGIEGFVNLQTLKVMRQELRQIDLYKNTRLDTLYLQGNLLQSIDLSKNRNLVDVNLGTNELTSIQGLSELNTLKQLDLSWNYLEAFSISNASVETLSLNLNELQSLDVSEAENLKTLILTSNTLKEVSLGSNLLLETLVISDNALESIDLTQNSELQYFYASSNALTDLDVSQNQNLVDLRIDRNPGLTCITIHPGQEILTVRKSEYQEMQSECG
jgi:hypothetical protein